ncbi:MAG: hypothetical protein ABSC06_35720, partial [Rhodopila sp.]
MIRPIRECSVTRRKIAAHHADIANVFRAGVKDGLSRPELEALLLEVFGKLAAAEKTNGEQREEIARLKGLKGRPTIKPSGMDN